MAIAKQDFIDDMRAQLYRQMSDSNYRLLRTKGLRGELMHNRMMMLARQITVEDNDFLGQDVGQGLIRPEVQIPAQIFYHRMDISAWAGLPSDLFYTVGDNWSATLVDSFPAFAEVSDNDVLKDFGLVDGEHDAVSGIVASTVDLVRDRRNWVVEWAVREYPNSINLIGQHISGADKRKAQVFVGLVYNTVLQSLLDSNLSATASKWRHVKANAIPAADFVSHLTTASSIATNLDHLRRNDRVYTFNNHTGELIEARRPDFENHMFTPDFATDDNHFKVRSILGMPQDAGASDATLVNLTFVDATDATLSPEFGAERFVFSVVMSGDESLTVNLTKTYTHTAVTVRRITFVPMTSVVVEPNEDGYYVVATGIGKTCIQVETVSQDKREKKTYQLLVVRTS